IEIALLRRLLDLVLLRRVQRTWRLSRLLRNGLHRLPRRRLRAALLLRRNRRATGFLSTRTRCGRTTRRLLLLPLRGWLLLLLLPGRGACARCVPLCRVLVLRHRLSRDRSARQSRDLLLHPRRFLPTRSNAGRTRTPRQWAHGPGRSRRRSRGTGARATVEAGELLLRRSTL